MSWLLFVALAVPYGVAWSALLTAASAEAARVVPVARRAEGLAYHGLAMSAAIAVAPALGFALLAVDWRALAASLVAVNGLAALLARRLPADAPLAPRALAGLAERGAVEWRVLGLSTVLLLCTVGYGGTTSFIALLCRERGIRPQGIFFTAFAVAVFALRPLIAPWIDRVGPRRALPGCILALAVALGWLPFQTTAAGVAAGGLLMGAGFSALYPAFSTLVLSRIAPERRGAAFGAMLAAFDVGIGGGSLAFGPVVERWGYGFAFGGSAALALAAWPLLARGARRWERAGVSAAA
jgi:predicted MFS family arabinose efflux permease